MIMTRDMEATDPGGNIYALMSFSHTAENLTVDYGISVDKLFKDIIVSFLEDDLSLALRFNISTETIYISHLGTQLELCTY